MNDSFVRLQTRNMAPAHRNFYFALVFAAAVFAIILVSLFVAPPRACIGATTSANGSDVVAAEFQCARFIDLPESEQLPSLCIPQLQGRCTTTNGVCSTFAFVNDTTVAAHEQGYIGQSYRCGNVGCTEVGLPCMCNQPLIYPATRFCRRANSAFACYSLTSTNLTGEK